MPVELTLSSKWRAGRVQVPPVADNDDDPFDPPPARAQRAPAAPVVTLSIPDAARVEVLARAA